MSYCVNCGKGYEQISGICPSCHLDQTVPEAVMDIDLSRRRDGRFDAGDLQIGFPGEHGALGLALAASAALAVILGAVSLGAFIVLFVGSLLYLKAAHLSAKRHLLPVSDSSFERIFRLMKVAAYRLRLPLPEVYVTHDPVYNAATRGFGRHGFIVVNSGLVEDFSQPELLFIIGHEMGHIKRYHTTWLTLIAPGTAQVPGFLFAWLMGIIFNVWSIKSEYTADQAGLIACNDLETAARALLKVSGGAGVDREVDIQKVLRDGRDLDSPASDLAELLRTHPFSQNRVRHLSSFASSSQYRSSRWWVREGQQT